MLDTILLKMFNYLKCKNPILACRWHKHRQLLRIALQTIICPLPPYSASNSHTVPFIQMIPLYSLCHSWNYILKFKLLIWLYFSLLMILHWPSDSLAPVPGHKICSISLQTYLSVSLLSLKWHLFSWSCLWIFRPN